MSGSTILRIAVTITVSLAANAVASAQGLIWSLPPDGSWVRYEGTYNQENVRADSNEGNLKLEWIRQLTIKSVGSETAEFEGVSQPCRWIEIKVVTGSSSEAGIDPGPAGAVLYKVLVPESKIIGKAVDDETIPVSMMPIVKGFRRAGEGEVRPITSGALRMYPSISLLSNYPDAEVVAQDVSPGNIPIGNVSATHYRGSIVMEKVTSRSRNIGEFWVSRDVPFGLAQWTVKTERFGKDSTDPRTEFREVSKVNVTMTAHEIGTDAQSELSVQ